MPGMDYIKVSNVHPKLKKRLKDIAKEEDMTMATMLRKIFKKAADHYEEKGDFIFV